MTTPLCIESRETPKKDHEISATYDLLSDSIPSPPLLHLFFICLFKMPPPPTSRSHCLSPLLPSNQPTMSSSAAAAGSDHAYAPHVLAVDDNVVDRKLIERLFSSVSCRVTTAENGMKALEYLGLGDKQPEMGRTFARTVNLIVTDYCMPGMTGYELLKKLKKSTMTKDVPVVVVSSDNIPSRISECMEEGARMFMQKPLKASDVKKMRFLLGE